MVYSKLNLLISDSNHLHVINYWVWILNAPKIYDQSWDGPHLIWSNPNPPHLFMSFRTHNFRSCFWVTQNCTQQGIHISFNHLNPIWPAKELVQLAGKSALAAFISFIAARQMNLSILMKSLKSDLVYFLRVILCH